MSTVVLLTVINAEDVGGGGVRPNPFPVTFTVTDFSLEASDGMSKLFVKVPWLIGLNLTLKLHSADGCTARPEQASLTMLKGAARGFA